LQVIAKQANQALHVLDRFHITQHLNKAVDEVRRGESSRLREAGKAKAEQLKGMRWKLLRRGASVRGRTREKLQRLLWSKLATGRAWQLKESFEGFWRYRHVTWARTYLNVWCTRARRSRLEPMKKVARMLLAHEELILNWFRAKGELSSGAVEGLNNKIRVITRRSYGLRTYKAMEVALYHNLGRLPEPAPINNFC
jgi:transposase